MKTGLSKKFGFVRMLNQKEVDGILAEKNHVIESNRVSKQASKQC